MGILLLAPHRVPLWGEEVSCNLRLDSFVMERPREKNSSPFEFQLPDGQLEVKTRGIPGLFGWDTNLKGAGYRPCVF